MLRKNPFIKNNELPPIENPDELAKLARLLADKPPIVPQQDAPALTAPVPQSAWQSVAPPEQPFALPPIVAPGMAEPAPFDRSEVSENYVSQLPEVGGAQTAAFAPPPPLNLPIIGANQAVPSPPAPKFELPTLGSEQTQRRIADVYAKDYSKQRTDEAGNVIREAGKDRDKDWSWKEKAGGIGLGLLEGLLSGRGLLGGIPGAIKNATDRNFMEKRSDVESLSRLLPQLGQQQKQESEERDGRLREAQIATIPVDDENKRLQIAAQREAMTLRQQEAAKRRFAGLKYFDPKRADHVQAAKDAGYNPEDLEGFDDRNPVTKQVAGITYQYNRATGAFEPSGLPSDESKTLIDYSVKTPTGEVRTYKVPQEKAASFATQMQAQQYSIEAADRRQTSQQTFQADQNEKNRAQARSLAGARLQDAQKNRDFAREKFEWAKANGTTDDIRQAEKELEAQRQSRIRLKAFLKNSVLISPTDSIFDELDALDQ